MIIKSFAKKEDLTKFISNRHFQNGANNHFSEAENFKSGREVCPMLRSLTGKTDVSIDIRQMVSDDSLTRVLRLEGKMPRYYFYVPDVQKYYRDNY